jgi:hypothetical protein
MYYKARVAIAALLVVVCHHNHNHNQYTLMYDKERLLQCCWFGTNTSLWYHSVAGGGLLKKQD